MEESVFYRTVQAVISGKRAELKELLTQYPGLPQSMAPRAHQATLLHYAMANGVEDEWQQTPAEIVEIVRMLLASGAEPDALARWDGIESPNHTPLISLVTSVWPAKAGKQEALIGELIQAGAKVDGLQGDQAPLGAAVAFGYTKAAEQLVKCGAQAKGIRLAAALGDMEYLESCFDTAGKLSPGSTVAAIPFLGKGESDQDFLNWAFVYACMHHQSEAASLLLQKGAHPDAKGHQGMSALHYAVWYEQEIIFSLLMQHGASLEVKNDYGGTVLDFLCWLIAQNPQLEASRMPYFYRLLQAGADPFSVSPLPSAEISWVQEVLFFQALHLVKQGDIEAFAQLLASYPELASWYTRSPLSPYDGYFHQATLLHHLAGNPTLGPLPANTTAYLHLLLEHGAKVDAPSGKGDWQWTTLGLVASGTQALNQQLAYPLIDLLSSAGADPNWGDGIALYGSLIHAHTHPELRELAAYLVYEKGAHVDLAYAAGVGSISNLEACFAEKAYTRYRMAEQRFANPDRSYILGEALIFAAFNGRVEAIDWLVAHGADVQQTAPLHQEWPTALHAAIWANWPQTVEHLLELGASPAARDPKHHSDALGWANHLKRPGLIPIIQRKKN